MAPARRSRRQTADTAIIDWTDHAVLADLSPELLNRVFQHLSSSSQSKGSVAVIALGNASRTLREIAVRHLFRRIVYEFSEVRRNDRLVATLRLRPSLGAHIRRLSLRRTPFSSASGPTDLERAIAVLQHAGSLTDLELRTRLRHENDEAPADLAAELLAALQAFGLTLKRLILTPALAETITDVQQHLQGRWKVARPLAVAFPSWVALSSLELWQVTFEGVDLPPNKAPFRLAKLSISHVTLPAQHLRWLLDASGSGGLLQDLELTNVHPPTGEAELASFGVALVGFLHTSAAALRYLALHLTVKGVLQGDKAVEVFSKLLALRRLAITAEDFAGDQAAALLTSSTRLEQLSLAACDSLEPSYVIYLVRKTSIALRTLRIDTLSDAFVSDPSNDRPPRHWPWARQERRDLRATCEIKGISLTLDGSEQPVEAELSDVDEGDPTSFAPALVDDDEDAEDALFVFDDERRARCAHGGLQLRFLLSELASYEDERARDRELLAEAREREAAALSSADEFMAPTSEEDV